MIAFNKAFIDFFGFFKESFQKTIRKIVILKLFFQDREVFIRNDFSDLFQLHLFLHEYISATSLQ